jgi:hypothetical protein
MILRKINIKSLLTFLMLQFNTGLINADVQSSQAQSLIMKDLNDKPKIVEKFDSEELLKQLEAFESYRPDSFSDATRNPFDRKRYEFNNLKESTLK